MKINKTTYTFILIAGILLILNGIRLFIGVENILGSDFSVIMMLWGTVFGMFFTYIGGKGFKDQEMLPRFWKRWKYKIIIILAGVIILTLINLN